MNNFVSRLLVSALAALVLCAQLSTVLSSPAPRRPGLDHLSDEELKSLVDASLNADDFDTDLRFGHFIRNEVLRRHQRSLGGPRMFYEMVSRSHRLLLGHPSTKRCQFFSISLAEGPVA